MERCRQRPELAHICGWPRLAAMLVSITLAAGACSATSPAPPSTASLSIASPVAATSRPPDPTPTLLEPSTHTPPPASTPTPTPTPAPAPSSSPTPSPAPSPTPTASTAPAETVVDTYAWVFDKHPMTLKGEAGTTRFTHVLFGAKTVDLRWKAEGHGTACAFAASVVSSLMARTVKLSAKVKAAKPASGTRGITANYGDATITVTTDCAAWSIRAVSTGHPGLVIKQQTRTFAIEGDTAAPVKDGLDDAHLDWWINYTYRYRTPPLRLTSLKTTVRVVSNLPAWTPPAAASQTLIAEWKTAIAALRTHQAGDAVIAIQAAGRFQESAARRTGYRSPTAMQDAIERRCSSAIESAQDRINEYDIFTRRGFTQGVDIG